jgi:hypothetical protein
LDRIVAGLLDTLGPDAAVPPPRSRSGQPEPQPRPSLAASIADLAARRAAATRPVRSPSDDFADANPPTDLFTDMPLPEERDRRSAASEIATEPFLTEEEEEFIARTVAWLAARPDPDILLERIWNLVVPGSARDEAAAAEEAGDSAGPPVAKPETDEG